MLYFFEPTTTLKMDNVNIWGKSNSSATVLTQLYVQEEEEQ